MKNTDKFDCLAVKECIIKGLIDINKLSKEELYVLIDFETDNIIECDTEPDMSFLDTCYDAMHKFEDYRNDVSDEKIQEEYFETLRDVLGSQAEIMEERGYDEVDIRERRKFEKYMDEKSDLLAEICEKRGIKLWGEGEQ